MGEFSSMMPPLLFPDIIKKSALMETPSLVFLNVSHNRIVNVEVDAFKELSQLVTLDLSYNR